MPYANSNIGVVSEIFLSIRGVIKKRHYQTLDIVQTSADIGRYVILRFMFCSMYNVDNNNTEKVFRDSKTNFFTKKYFRRGPLTPLPP